MAWCLSNIIEDMDNEKEAITYKPGQSIVETDSDAFDELLNSFKETNVKE